MSTTASFSAGEAVVVMWAGTARYGVVAGDTYSDSLPTGARFVPIVMDDDGQTHNVDTRVVRQADY